MTDSLDDQAGTLLRTCVNVWRETAFADMTQCYGVQVGVGGSIIVMRNLDGVTTVVRYLRIGEDVLLLFTVITGYTTLSSRSVFDLWPFCSGV